MSTQKVVAIPIPRSDYYKLSALAILVDSDVDTLTEQAIRKHLEKLKREAGKNE